MFGNEFTIESMVYSSLEIFMNGIDSNLQKFLVTEMSPDVPGETFSFF